MFAACPLVGLTVNDATGGVQTSGVTVKSRWTVGAAANCALPAWSARTLHVPTAISVIVAPLVPLEVQTRGVVVENVTVRPEEAVAVTVKGGVPSI